MSVPITIDLPSGYRRVAWQGRMGAVQAVVGEPQDAFGRVLLVPGFTGSKEDYFELLGPLQEFGWAVAAADLPGMYESEGSADAEDYSLNLLAGDVLAMARTWGQGRPVHLVGHSTSGLISRHAAVADPSALASLTLYDSGSGPLVPQARWNVEMLLGALADHTPGEVHRLKNDLDRAAGRPLPPPEVYGFLAKRWSSTSPGHLRGMAHILLTADDPLDELAALARSGDLPVLTLYGEADTTTWQIDAFAHVAERIGSAVAVIPNAEHSPAVENPSAMVAALSEFWHRLP